MDRMNNLISAVGCALVAYCIIFSIASVIIDVMTSPSEQVSYDIYNDCVANINKYSSTIFTTTFPDYNVYVTAFHTKTNIPEIAVTNTTITLNIQPKTVVLTTKDLYKIYNKLNDAFGEQSKNIYTLTIDHCQVNNPPDVDSTTDTIQTSNILNYLVNSESSKDNTYVQISVTLHVNLYAAHKMVLTRGLYELAREERRTLLLKWMSYINILSAIIFFICLDIFSGSSILYLYRMAIGHPQLEKLLQYMFGNRQ